MKKLPFAVLAFALSISADCAFAEESKKPTTTALNETCPLSGKPVDPKITGEYEGRVYAFESEGNRTQWLADREASLYQQIGGKAAISAAVDLFYTKVLADERVNGFFEDVSMRKQHNSQKAFLGAALGGPEPWTGRDMRKAHEGMELTEVHFGAIAEAPAGHAGGAESGRGTDRKSDGGGSDDQGRCSERVRRKRTAIENRPNFLPPGTPRSGALTLFSHDLYAASK